MNTIANRYVTQENTGLRYGIVEVTTGCQLKCPGCYMVRRSALNKGEMTLQDAISVLDLCKEYRGGTDLETMDILGGEPLIWPHLKPYIEELLRRNIKPWIFTNMVGASAELAGWLYERRVHITGKLNIGNPSDPAQLQLQAEMLGSTTGMAKRMITAIDIFTKAGYADPLFRLQNLIRKSNLHLVPDYIRYCRTRGIGVDMELMGSGEPCDENYFKIAPTAAELAQLVRTLEKQGRDYMQSYGSAMDDGLWPEFDQPVKRLLMPHLFGSCPFYDKGLYFACNGTIRSCSNSTLTLALTSEPDCIKKAYESPLICSRKKLTQERVGEPCHSCDRWQKCRGGCRATVEGSGDPFGGYKLCPLPLLRENA